MEGWWYTCWRSGHWHLLIHGGMLWASEGLVPRSSWWRAEKGSLAVSITTCQMSQSWKKGDLNLIHMVPKNELVWVLQALCKDSETSTPKLSNRRALLQAVKLFPVTRGPDTPDSFNCRVSLQWTPWHPLLAMLWHVLLSMMCGYIHGHHTRKPFLCTSATDE